MKYSTAMGKKEVISIHIGQAGIQMGTAFWELLLLEHCIGPDGFTTFQNDHDDSFKCFFDDINKERFIPRAIFLDTEPNVVVELKCGIYKNLFHPDNIISGIEDGANNFARGSFTLGRRHMLEMLDRIRKSVEICENIQGFMISHSFSGGTGSGLTSVLLHALSNHYAKVSKIQVPIFPGPSLASAIVEPYNCAFHIHSTMDITDMAFIFDNEAMYNICQNYLLMYAPNFTNINRILALINSATTCSMRFYGSPSVNLEDMRMNLIPYPRIHFPTVAHVPLTHTSRAKHHTISTAQLSNDVFSPNFQMVRCNLNRGRYIAIMLNGRGLISPIELNNCVRHIKSDHDLNFVEWSPSGFKLCLNTQTPSTIPESEIAISEKSLTMICNSTAIKQCWLSIAKKFDLLYTKKAFIHWFVGEGMEEIEFEESRFDLELLAEDYEELSKTKRDLDEEIIQDPSRRFRISYRNESKLVTEVQ